MFLFAFPHLSALQNFKVAKANKNGARLLNFAHSSGEVLLNFLEEHFNCNEFHQTFEHQFIADQNSKYATEMSIFILFGKILTLCIPKSFDVFSRLDSEKGNLIQGKRIRCFEQSKKRIARLQLEALNFTLITQIYFPKCWTIYLYN